MTRSANPINWNIQTIAETINPVHAISIQIHDATVGGGEFVRATRDSDNQIMDLSVIPNNEDDTLIIGWTTATSAKELAEDDYIDTSAVTIDELEEFVATWAEEA